MAGRWQISELAGRGIIATASLILVGIPSSCQTDRSNLLKEANQSLLVEQRADELGALKRQQFRIEEEIRATTAAIASSQSRLDALDTRYRPAAEALAEKLRLLQRVEEDLVAAKAKQPTIETELSALTARAQQLATQQKQSEEWAEKLKAAERDIAKRRGELQQKATVLAELAARLKGLSDLEAQVQKLLFSVGAMAELVGGKAPPVEPAKKKSPVK